MQQQEEFPLSPKKSSPLLCPSRGAAQEGAVEVSALLPGMPQHQCARASRRCPWKEQEPEQRVAESCHMVPLWSLHQPARANSHVFHSPGARVKCHVQAGESGPGGLFLSLKSTAP